MCTAHALHLARVRFPSRCTMRTDGAKRHRYDAREGSATSGLYPAFSLRALCCQARRSQTRPGKKIRLVSSLTSDSVDSQDVPESLESSTSSAGFSDLEAGAPAFRPPRSRCGRRREVGAPVARLFIGGCMSNHDLTWLYGRTYFRTFSFSIIYYRDPLSPTLPPPNPQML